jgi:hypothetical protein
LRDDQHGTSASISKIASEVMLADQLARHGHELHRRGVLAGRVPDQQRFHQRRASSTSPGMPIAVEARYSTCTCFARGRDRHKRIGRHLQNLVLRMAAEPGMAR